MSKKIRLTAIEDDFDDFDDYEELGRREGRRWDLQCCLASVAAVCAAACVLIFTVRAIWKHVRGR
ncbi:MAG: hypothetical protein HFF55_10135 [Lawsonibacter sp.]|nr:hypothetical protein [Lawsonibacter sp.]